MSDGKAMKKVMLVDNTVKVVTKSKEELEVDAMVLSVQSKYGEASGLGEMKLKELFTDALVFKPDLLQEMFVKIGAYCEVKQLTLSDSLGEYCKWDHQFGHQQCEQQCTALVRDRVSKEQSRSDQWHALRGGDHFSYVDEEVVGGTRWMHMKIDQWAAPGTTTVVPVKISSSLYEKIMSRTRGRNTALTHHESPLKRAKGVKAESAKKKKVKEVQEVKSGMKVKKGAMKKKQVGIRVVAPMKAMK